MGILNSVLNASLPQSRNRVDGVQTSNSEILDKVLKLFQTHKILTARAIGENLGVSREHAQREYVKPLIAAGKIKKIETSKGQYQLIDDTTTKADLTAELYSESEVMQTQFFRTWIENNTAKQEHKKLTRFARICLGEINPKFKIHPDAITKENWETVIITIRKMLLELTNKKNLGWGDRQVLRHAVKYGLDVNLSEEKGIRLGISGEKDKPKSADLRISSEQVEQSKKLLKKLPLEFVKFGVKSWTFCRPSSMYLIETNDLKFYDRTVLVHSSDLTHKS